MKKSNLLGAVCACLAVASFNANAKAPENGRENGAMYQLLDRLQIIEAKLDSVQEELDAPPTPSTSATFCISQGRGLELGADWAGELKLELEGGLGWAEVGDVKITVSPSMPVVVPIGLPPFAIPIPLPTEAKIGVKGGIGRVMDICIDVPITLSPEDETRLTEIAKDINAKTGNSFIEKGKFQRRAGRILNYAAVRVPGNQRTLMMAADPISANLTDADAEIEFDRADNAVANIMDNGLGTVTEGLDVFNDTDIRELLATLEVPVGVKNFMEGPEIHLFDGLPDLSGGVRNLLCNELGVTARMRENRPRLDSLCNRLENLPSFERAIQALELGSEITEDIIEGVRQVMANTISGVADTTAEAKARFCASDPGQRRVFNVYCGR
ncbi:MAG: hypothetical protein OEY45_06885 [Gammaproteobacteria bacterium]|nr:hypothetical protein [Gammaproteobacteria bacterium]